MQRHCVRMLLSAAIACLLAPAAWSAEAVALESGGVDVALEARLAAEESSLKPQRLAFQQHFAEAYARYPSIPAGTLEAIAYVQSRWMHLVPQATVQTDDHHHMPGAYGVMGLYAGEGFADQVSDAAGLLRVSPAAIKRNPRLNVLAAAALLDREIRTGAEALWAGKGSPRPTPEAIRPALQRYAGFPESLGKSEVADYARTSFAFDILLAQDRGVDDRGIKVPERAIEWERAFDTRDLVTQRAPFVRLDVTKDRVEAENFVIDPVTETLVPKDGGSAPAAAGAQPKSTDYAPARWVASPYNNPRASYSSVTIHTMQGGYPGTISWFQSNPFKVSAHYLIRSSDGQVTQMVRNSRSANHIIGHNSTSLGIEHEGFVNNSSWYTTAMYNSSAALTRNLCNRYDAIVCDNAYNGSASSGINVLSTSIDVKGHQHYSGQDHTDPGINWNWRRYYLLLNPDGGGTTPPPGGGGDVMLDNFESSVGHFNTSPTFSGSTTGISDDSSATRDCSVSRHGSCSLRVLLKDDTGSADHWWVRLLSESGSPSGNVSLARASGRVGFWVYAGGSDMRVAIGIDDSDGTERAVSKALSANTWTYVQWALDDSTQWLAWAGNSNGAITSSTVKLDAIWIFREQDTAFDVNVYIDEVQIRH
ncbi:MAG: N-acetylmuramoyl-L-alanine amidase [Lysobacterales bacterium]